MRGAQKRRHLKNALPIGTATKTWNERRLCLLTVGCTNHQLDIRRIRSFPPNCYDISPFSEPRPAPTQTTDSFSTEHLSRTYYSLLGSVNCQKTQTKKTPTSSFCRFVKNWEQTVTMTILVNYISIQPPRKNKNSTCAEKPSLFTWAFPTAPLLWVVLPGRWRTGSH